MNQALKKSVVHGGYAVDPYAVATAMLASGRAPIPLKRPAAAPGLDVLVAPEVIDGDPPRAGQDQPTALEGTA